MQDEQAAPDTRAGRGSGNGGPGIPVRPVDRSHLLRKTNRFPFPVARENDLVRIRRQRRVCESFSGIRSLSRREND